MGNAGMHLLYRTHSRNLHCWRLRSVREASAINYSDLTNQYCAPKRAPISRFRSLWLSLLLRNLHEEIDYENRCTCGLCQMECLTHTAVWPRYTFRVTKTGRSQDWYVFLSLTSRNVPGKNVEVEIAVRVITFDTPRWVDITFSSPRFMTPVPVHIRCVTSTVYNSKRNDSYLTTTRVYSSQYICGLQCQTRMTLDYPLWWMGFRTVVFSSHQYGVTMDYVSMINIMNFKKIIEIILKK